MIKVTSQLHSSTNGYIEAPAGFGKTYLILDTIKNNPGDKQLVLTHTIAGVASLRSKMKQHGVDSSSASIETIAGWCQRYVLAFPGIARADLEILRTRDPAHYWNHIYGTFNNLLENPHVKQIIKHSYGGVYVDEYQDCTKRQHQVIIELMKILPVRILGDPLQGIFNMIPDEMIDWSQVEDTFIKQGTLNTPHRWNQAGNPEYGEWIKEVRASLLMSRPLDLGKAPTCVKVVMLTEDYTSNLMAIISEARQALAAGSRRLIIGDKVGSVSKSLVVKLSRPRYKLLESIYSKDITELRRWAVTMDNDSKDDKLILFDILIKCFSGLPSNLKTAAQKIAIGAGSGSKHELVLALSDLHDTFSPIGALRVLSVFESHADTSCHRYQPATIIEMALVGVSDGRYNSLYESLEAAIASLSRRGRTIPKYSIGSTLLVKGLEVEEAIVMNAHTLSKNDLYVALSRPTKKITIFTNNNILSPTT